MAIRPSATQRSGDRLRQLLGLPPGPQLRISGVTLDSRRVRPGDLYAALPGFTTHGARFVAMAAQQGAAAVLTDPAGEAIVRADAQGPTIPLLVVADPRGVLGEVSAWVYGYPARELRTTGLTGTNGKTTTSYLLDAALRAAGRVTGVIGTVAAQLGDEVLPATRTTPEAPDLHALLAVLRERGATDVTLEVSSHALQLGRVDGVRFDLAVFTNLSRDHLDFHGDMESYFAAKAQLFTPARAAAALVCVDDPWGRRMAQHARGQGLPTQTYALDGPADWTLRDLAAGVRGASTFTVVAPGTAGSVDAAGLPGGVGLPGRFNAANALAAVAAAVHAGVTAGVAVAAVQQAPGVPGRMERVRADDELLAIVDYAHTPDAVLRAIAAARAATTGRLIVVLGCGGDRDREKRPVMGEVAARGADVLIVTDDNPRSESAPAIRGSIIEGTARVPAPQRAEVVEQGDRRSAIMDAVRRAATGDAVLVLGKGHEQGQEAAGVTTPFDDRVELRRAMEALR